MADYKELIRRAIQALPENNGASRRAVYEKARAALVGQLRGISPPLAARDITQHRLQLEDCIRQVEQEASEAVIAGLKQNEQLTAKPAPAVNGAAPASGRGGTTPVVHRPAAGITAFEIWKPMQGTYRMTPGRGMSSLRRTRLRARGGGKPQGAVWVAG